MLTNIQLSILSSNEITGEGLRGILTARSCIVDTLVADPQALPDPAAHPGRPHIVIIVDTDPIDGIEACRQVRSRLPDARILLMDEEYKLDTTARAFEAGADGFVMKAICCDGLESAIKLLSVGEKVLPSQLASGLSALRFRPPSRHWDIARSGANLSSREMEILRCLVAGEANKLISRHLGITEATVKVHVKAILRKLNVANRTQAAIWAVIGGLAHDERDELAPSLDDTIAILTTRERANKAQSTFMFTQGQA